MIPEQRQIPQSVAGLSNITPRSNVYRDPRIIWGAVGILIVLSLLFVRYCGGAEQHRAVRTGQAPQAVAKEIPIQATHRVARNEYINLIATKYTNVGGPEIVLANEEFLKAKYEEVCDDLSARYRKNSRRHGTFCNDRYNRPYQNTLLPGWQLRIPGGKAPRSIEQAIVNMGNGKTVALVIDDTGSIQNDRLAVATFYTAALHKYGKSLKSICLYNGAEPRCISPEANLEYAMKTSGGYENTHRALNKAAESNPDAIILITDERGEDWNWNNIKLPPVIGTCIPDQDLVACEENLRRLAKMTNGQYVPAPQAGFGS